MPFDAHRRFFLKSACAFAVAGCGGSTTAPAGDTGDTGSTSPGTTPVTEDQLYPCGQTIGSGADWSALPLAEYPDLETVGGWYGVTVAGQSIVVAHVSEGCYSAIVRACAHEGVAIDYRPDRGQFVCPRHAAVYAPDGSKVSGPQPSGLPVFACGRVDDVIYVRVV